ncbi:DUF4062 domain-containing protein [Gymnodinialimonas sp. 2305UL16-5]|uniref:DUF4062 domain-containing protein n=1 Tax=Rhodobacterales TaxID=204455 RepID=UPI00248F5791|nr:DUF4062 domain-containing protein [Phaeobacter inhibens]
MKKYQVFVSSTFLDLKEERQAVSQNILELNHIPVGMEFFGAADQEQMEFIKDEIRNSDYYVLIIGGKYGSVDPKTGKSYTQLEYEFASEIGIPVLVFLRKNRHDLPVEQRDTDGEKISKLDAFILAASGAKRIRDEWETLPELVNKSGNALNKEIGRTASKAVGWIRADKAISLEAREKIHELESELDELRRHDLDPVLNASNDPQSLYDAVSHIVSQFAEAELSQSERAKLRSSASNYLNELILQGLKRDVPSNLAFNSAVEASRLDMDVIALKLFTLAEYFQPTPSHRLAMLHKRAETGSSYSVDEDNGKLTFSRTADLPQKISLQAFEEALTLAGDARIAQCEIAYSQAWNISQQLREFDALEQLLAVLTASKCARVAEDLPNWLPLSTDDIEAFKDFNWADQAGRTVPSYLVGKMADCVAFLSFAGWKEVFFELVTEALILHKDESPMATWSSHFRKDLLQTAQRTELLGEVDVLIQKHHGSDIQSFASLVM